MRLKLGQNVFENALEVLLLCSLMLFTQYVGQTILAQMMMSKLTIFTPFVLKNKNSDYFYLEKPEWQCMLLPFGPFKI